MKEKDNKMAFPGPSEAGLTKREYLAALAMQTLITTQTGSTPAQVAKLCFEYADAMCKESLK